MNSIEGKEPGIHFSIHIVQLSGELPTMATAVALHAYSSVLRGGLLSSEQSLSSTGSQVPNNFSLRKVQVFMACTSWLSGEDTTGHHRHSDSHSRSSRSSCRSGRTNLWSPILSACCCGWPGSWPPAYSISRLATFWKSNWTAHG